MNNDHCFLTALEKYIRKVDDNESFMYSIIAPVYNLPHNISNVNYNSVIYKLLFVLWSISIYKIKIIYDKRTQDTKNKFNIIKNQFKKNKFKILFGIFAFMILSHMMVKYIIVQNHRMYLIEH